MSAKPHRQLVGKLVGVVDAPLRKVEDIHTDWAEARDDNLADRAKLILNSYRQARVLHRPIVRYTGGTRQCNVK